MRSALFARDSLDLTAETVMPRDCAIFAHGVFFCLPELDYLAIDRWQPVDGFPQQFMSLSADVVALRVVHRGLRLPRSRSFPQPSPPSIGISWQLRFLRKIISAELIAIRVSQVEKLDLPSKFFM